MASMMTSPRRLLALALAVAVCLPSEVLGCQPKKVHGNRTMPGRAIGKANGYFGVQNAAACLKFYCAKNNRCQSVTYWPNAKRCFLYTANVRRLVFNKDRRNYKEVWSCKVGTSGRRTYASQTTNQSPVLARNAAPFRPATSDYGYTSSGCEPNRVPGDRTMPGTALGRPKGYGGVKSAADCLVKFCEKNKFCKTVTYWPTVKLCFLYSANARNLIFNKDRQIAKEVWNCKVGTSSKRPDAPQTKYQPPKVGTPYRPISTFAGDRPQGGGGGGGGMIRAVVSGRSASQGRLAFKAGCTRLVSTRLDPIVNPGQISGHVHDVFGAVTFGSTVNNNELKNNVATTCNFPQDRSLYWSPSLYGRLPNGRMTIIPSVVQAYYHTTGIDNDLHAFPKGLRYLFGDPGKRSGPGYSRDDRVADIVNWICHKERKGGGLEVDKAAFGGFPGAYSTDGRPCRMIQARMYYPSCWNGVNLDSSDHKSHMAYAVNRRCPASHPVQVPQLKLETVFRLTPYLKAWGNRVKPMSFYTLSNGDTTGFSMHSDFISGWDENELARILKNCNDGRGKSCPLAQYANRVIKVGTYRMYKRRPTEQVDLVTRPPTGKGGF